MITNTKTQTNQPAITPALLLLGSRLVLFLVFQAMIALWISSWERSENYWLLTATLTNMVSIALLIVLFRREGNNYFRIFSFNRASLKKDLLIFAGLALLSIPLVMLPGHFLSMVIWGDPDVPTGMMFGPVEEWLVCLLIVAFPITIAMSELATYFRYIMPKLALRFKREWLAVLLPVLFLSIQHCTLPFVPDFSFILYRALAFLPFAALIGVSIHYRPSLFIFFAILHGLLDFGTALMFLIQK
jgi:hypothetical protein